MKVFQLKTDYKYPGFATWSGNKGKKYRMVYPSPMLPDWSPLPMYFERSSLTLPNFCHSFCGGYALDPYAYSLLGSLLKQSNELLPLQPHEGRPFHLLNVLDVVDCLDKEKTQFRLGKASGKYSSQVVEYHFCPDRLSSSPVFRLPGRVELLTATGVIDSELEFKKIVEHESLTGIMFEEIWNGFA